MYANLNKVVVYYSNWNEAVWSSLKLQKLFEVPQKWIELFEVTQNWIKMFHLARIWMELLLLLKYTHVILDIIQIWIKLL